MSGESLDQRYKLLLERLDAAFPGRELLTKTEAAKLLGLNRTAMYRKYPKLPAGRISKVTLAREILRAEDECGQQDRGSG